MSIEAIQDQLRALSPDQRRKMLAFMVALEDEGKPGYAATLKERIDDNSPGRWFTAEECERELGLSDDKR